MRVGLLGMPSGKVVDLARYRRKVARARAEAARSRPEMVYVTLKDIVLKAAREVGLRNLDLGKLLAAVASETNTDVSFVRHTLEQRLLPQLRVHLDGAKYTLDVFDWDDES